MASLSSIRLANCASVTSLLSAWLTAHPEATTTVQDGAVTRAKLDADLHADSVTGHVAIKDNETVTSLSLDDNYFFITAISNDGKGLDVYSVPINELVDVETAFKKSGNDDVQGLIDRFNKIVEEKLKEKEEELMSF